MKIRLTVVVLLLLVGAAFARADVRYPWDPPWHRHESPRHDFVMPPGVPLVVSVDAHATEARLIVPKTYLRSLAAASQDEAPRAEPGSLRWHVLAIPLAITLAAAGLWLTGLRPRLGARGLAVLLGVIVLGGVAGMTAWANPALPPGTPPPMIEYPLIPPLRGKVTVEVVEEGDAVKLILNRDLLNEFTSKP